MGFTHYLKQPSSFTSDQWAAFCAECKVIFDANRDILAGPRGEEGTQPWVNDDRIAFNGIGDESHETCAVTKDACGFDFCKTAHKEYDPIVVEVYKLVRKFLPDTELSSDGGPEVFE